MAGKSTGMCFVPNCLNAYFRGCRTRFFFFPKEEKLKKKWLRSLKLTSKDYNEGARICDVHFDKTDFTSNNPRSTLKKTAVPCVSEIQRYSDDSDAESIDIDKALANLSEVSSHGSDTNADITTEVTSSDTCDDEVLKKKKVTTKNKKKVISKSAIAKRKAKNITKLNENEDFMETETLEEELENIEEGDIENVLTQVCRTCLVTGCKMYSLKEYNLERTYLLLVGITSDQIDNSKVPQMICFECIRRLQNFLEFKEKSLTAWFFLKGLIQENKLTLNNIQSIDREQNLLTTKLSQEKWVDTYGTNNPDDDFKNENNQDNIFPDSPIYLYVLNESNKDDNANHLNTPSEYTEIDKKINEIDEFSHPLNKTEYMAIDKELNEVKNVSHALTPMEYSVIGKEINEFDNDRDYETESDQWDETKTIDYVIDAKSDEEATIDNVTEPKWKSEDSKKIIDKKGFKELFFVKDMTVEETKEEVKNRQYKPKYINSKFKCYQCYSGFKLEKKYRNHLIRHTNEYGQYVCDLCQLHYKKRRHLYNHIKRGHFKFISCRKCPFNTVFVSTALDHKNYHDGFRFQCEMCPSNYSKRIPYVEHVRRCHPEDVVCHICGFSFKDLQELNKHFSSAHHSEVLHFLPEMSSPYGSVKKKMESGNDYIAVSYVTTLPEGSPHCSKCDIRFRDQAALDVHYSVSPRHGNFSENEPNRIHLRRRRKVKNKDQEAVSSSYTCEQCGEEFPTYRMYTVHFRAEHPDKNRTQFRREKPQYICDICGKIFQPKSEAGEE